MEYRAKPVPCSRFFRNRGFFGALLDRVIPALLEGISGDRPVRIVSAGCGRGEEPYSLALALAGRFGPEFARGRFEILGLDADAEALSQARRGAFGAHQMEGVPPVWRERWFEPARGGLWRVRAELKGALRLEAGDLLLPWDVPLPCHLVLLRNVCLYLSPGGREEVHERARAALAPGGFLALGQSESLPEAGKGLWEPFDRLQRIYRKPAPGRARVAGVPAARG